MPIMVTINEKNVSCEIKMFTVHKIENVEINAVSVRSLCKLYNITSLIAYKVKVSPVLQLQ